jgi:hypothetical protein
VLPRWRSAAINIEPVLDTPKRGFQCSIQKFKKYNYLNYILQTI